MRMLRWICGHTRLDQVGNDDVIRQDNNVKRGRVHELSIGPATRRAMAILGLQRLGVGVAQRW
jgi:hypothetical protein